MDFSQLERYLDSLQKCGIPGCEMHVAHNGKVVYRHTAGFSDAACTRPADFSDTYRLFSCTKPLTVTCAMRLIEEGKLDPSDAVSKYLPEYGRITVKKGDKVVPAQNTMTVAHLLSMTGGLSYNTSYPEIKAAAADPNTSTRKMVASFAQVPLLFEPGEDYEYSLCHDVLGGIIEVVTGESLGEYMRKIIFEPLGMDSAVLRETDADPSNLADIYRYDTGLYRANPVEHSTIGFNMPPCYESGGAGAICTGSDYIKFAAAMANGGISTDGYRLLSMDSLKMMSTDRLSEAQRSKFIRTVGKPGYSYGYGVRTLTSREIGQSLSPLGEFGWDGMGGCYTLFDTENKVGIYFAMQVVGCGYCYSNVHPMLRNLTYQALEI